jgi:hypothetical protein
LTGNINNYNHKSEDDWKAECLQALTTSLGSGKEPSEVRLSFEARKGRKTKNTFRWLIDGDQLREWTVAEPSVLWISGGPGKGKTMLSLHLTKVLETRYASNPVIWHFCESGRGPNATNSGTILRSLILQLLKLNGYLFQYMPKPTVSYTELFGDGYFQTQWVIFEKMARHQSHTRINCILDGLDECEPDSLGILLEKLRTLFPDPQASDSDSSEESALGVAKPSKPASKLSIICTSRRQHPQCLQRHLKIYSNIDLDDSSNKIDIEEDVRTFVEERIRKVSKFATWPAPMQEKVTKTVASRSGGVYLWASFVIEELKHCQVVEIDQTLAEFPTELGAIYIRMLAQIRRNRRSVAIVLLKWVLSACRPLSLSELGAVTRVQPATGQSVEEAVTEQISFCNHLLERTNKFVSPCHSSVRDFLLGPEALDERIPEDFRFDFQKIHCEIALECLQYLEDLAVSGVPKYGHEGHAISEDQVCSLSAWHRLPGPQVRYVTTVPAYPLLPYAMEFTRFHVAFFEVSHWNVVLQRRAWKEDQKSQPMGRVRYDSFFGQIRGDGF